MLGGRTMYVLAIDGGGTKTTAVISDEFGHVHAKIITGRSNPTAMDAQHFEATIRNMLHSLQEQNPQVFTAIHSCFAGMAGVKEKNAEKTVESILREYIGNDAVIVIENDALIALYSGTLGQEGIVQIAGTGTITLGYDCQHAVHRVGGWGYLFDDEGGGYDLGIQALRAVFQSYDKRSLPTALSGALLEHFSVDNVAQLIDCIYCEEHPRTIIAPLSRYVHEAAERGDVVANAIIHEACEKFYHAIKTCYHMMSWDNGAVPVVLAGGVFSNKTLFLPKLEQLAIIEQLPVRFISTLLEPIGGAVVGALKIDGIQVDTNFVETFHEKYTQWGV